MCVIVVYRRVKGSTWQSQRGCWCVNVLICERKFVAGVLAVA